MTETYKLVYDKYDAKVAQILTQTGMRHDACNSRLLLKTYFLPRNVRRCGLCCRSVSVCLSVTLAEDIVKLSNFLFGPVARHCGFLDPSADTQFQGNPFSESAKYTGVGKICDFRPKSPFISETVRDRPSHRRRIDLC